MTTKYFRFVTICFLIIHLTSFSALAEEVCVFPNSSVPKGFDYCVNYDGRTYDSQIGVTTFQYTVEAYNTSGGQGFSHITFGIPECEPELTLSPEQTSPSGYTVGFDPTTLVWGIKWDNVTVEVGSPVTFTIGFMGNRAENPGGIDFSIKTGTCNSNQTIESGGHEHCPIGMITGVSCEEGENRPPECDANGPYESECGLGTGTVMLDGSNSSDPDNDPLTFLWSSDCPDALISDPTQAMTSMSFTTVDAQNNPISCTAFLTVMDTSEEEAFCQATVNVGNCETDCLGELGGNAQFDECGVCDGNNADKDACGVCFGNNEAMDECGVCFGNNEAKDACGVCFGDSSSCITCVEQLAAPSERRQAKRVRRAAKKLHMRTMRFAKAAKKCSKKRYRRLMKISQKSFRTLKEILRDSFMSSSLVCSNSVCAQASTKQTRRRLKRHTRKIFRCAKRAKLNTLRDCNVQHETTDTTRKITDDYRDDVNNAIRNLPLQSLACT